MKRFVVQKNKISLMMMSVLLLGTQAQSASKLESLTETVTDPMLAHEFKTKGPWFEGWYARVVDREKGISVAVITTSAISSGEKLPSEGPPGYIAIIISKADGTRTVSFEAFPKVTSIGNTAGNAASSSAGEKDFAWSAVNFGHASKNLTEVEIPNQAKIMIKSHSRVSWSDEPGEVGPEGNLAALPYLPLHWFVHNTGGEADYAVEYQENGEWVRLEGRGEIHHEKNWGETFPKSWMWVQAFNDNAYLALAGGDLKVGPLTAHSYMVGYRSKDYVIDFNIGQGPLTRFNDQIKSCDRKFQLDAINSEFKLVIEAEGDPESFADLAIPRKNGYEPNGAIETFTAKVKTRLYRAEGFKLAPRYVLVEEQSFAQGALEFGASAMTCAE